MEQARPILNKSERFCCSICRIHTNSRIQLKQHLNGEPHRYRYHKIMITFNEHKSFTGEHAEYDGKVYLLILLVISVTVYLFCYIIATLSYSYAEN